MKKIAYFTTVLALLSVVSCMDEKMESSTPEAEQSDNYVEFTANTNLTKTSLSQNGKEVVWNPNDKIMVFDATSKKGVEFTTDITENSPEATFKGNATPFNNTAYFAFYPNSAVKNWNTHNKIEITGSNFQKGIPESFPEGLHFSSALTNTDNMTLSFENILSYLKVKIVDKNVLSIQVDGYNIFASSMDYDPVNKKFTINKGIESIFFGSGTPGVPFNPGTYYIAVLPGEHFIKSITIRNTENTENTELKQKVITVNQRKNFTANTIYNIGEINNITY